MSDYNFNSKPKCPWCNHEVEEADELELAQDESTEIECDGCQKFYEITAHWSIDYSTVAVGCEKHKLKAEYFYDKELHQYSCTECKSEFYEWQLPNGRYPSLKEGEFIILEDD